MLCTTATNTYNTIRTQTNRHKVIKSENSPVFGPPSILRLVFWHSKPVSNSLSRDARLSRPVHLTRRGASRPAARSKYPAKRDSDC